MAQDINGTGDLTNGAYEKPTATDSGSTVFSILESFMERMASHKHEGTDSLLINKKLDKTRYYVTVPDSGAGWSTGTNGNKYLTINGVDSEPALGRLTDSNHYLAAGTEATAASGDTVLDITREFYYLKDNAIGNCDEHIRFYPDIVWGANDSIQIHTNIYGTIFAAASAPTIFMKVY